MSWEWTDDANRQPMELGHDEPASQLLARIRTNREQVEATLDSLSPQLRLDCSLPDKRVISEPQKNQCSGTIQSLVIHSCRFRKS